jgi:NAD(P)-dependent dehydrogenase (short-subunit alcohol dehydrogenase family)
MDLGLKGKVAVITGGSVGIGLAIAEGLAAEGVDIVIAARGVERFGREPDRKSWRPGGRVTLRCRARARDGPHRRREALSAPASLSTGQRHNDGARAPASEAIGICCDGRWRLQPRSRALMKKDARASFCHASIARPTPLVRADLQCDQSGADDVLEDADQLIGDNIWHIASTLSS